MSIFEYDEEKELRLIRESEREYGIELGIEMGTERGIEIGTERGIEILINEQLDEKKSKEEIYQKLEKYYDLDYEKARIYVDECIERRKKS